MANHCIKCRLNTKLQYLQKKISFCLINISSITRKIERDSCIPLQCIEWQILGTNCALDTKFNVIITKKRVWQCLKKGSRKGFINSFSNVVWDHGFGLRQHVESLRLQNEGNLHWTGAGWCLARRRWWNWWHLYTSWRCLEI